jgi:hypothetical protein
MKVQICSLGWLISPSKKIFYPKRTHSHTYTHTHVHIYDIILKYGTTTLPPVVYECEHGLKVD